MLYFTDCLAAATDSGIQAWLQAYPFAFWGLVGGMLGSHVKDDGLLMPSFKHGRLHLGSLFGIAAGMAAGHLADRSSVDAFIWGMVSGVAVRWIMNNADTLVKQMLPSLLQNILGVKPQNEQEEDDGKPA